MSFLASCFIKQFLNIVKKTYAHTHNHLKMVYQFLLRIFWHILEVRKPRVSTNLPEMSVHAWGKFESPSIVHTLMCTLIFSQPWVLLEIKNIYRFIYVYIVLTVRLLHKVNMRQSELLTKWVTIALQTDLWNGVYLWVTFVFTFVLLPMSVLAISHIPLPHENILLLPFNSFLIAWKPQETFKDKDQSGF